ncbi:MAG: TonB family protein [Acidobacteriaceae bacterium]
MRRMRGKILALAVLTMAIGAPLGKAQNPAAPAKGAPSAGTAADEETLAVEVVTSLSPVDRSNLKTYWTGVENRTHDRWIQVLPALAKPPQSTPGLVKIDCWVHTDGRVTGMTLEHPSGKAALDRAAWAAITGSAPYDAYPYGISVEQVRVRFTFAYSGNGGTATTSQTPVGVHKPR